MRTRAKARAMWSLLPEEIKLKILSRLPVKFKIHFIWNPFTKQYKEIPTEPTIDVRRGPLNISYGFGYNSKIRDYKFVNIVGFDSLKKSEVRVYKLGSNSWKRIKFIPYNFFSSGGVYGVLVNGALHWIIAHHVEESKASKIIVSFDIGDERVHEFALPKCLDDRFEMNVGVLGGRLCLLGNLHEVCVEVWVMKDYGVIESWTKLFTIPHHDTCIHYLSPIQSFKNGEILFEVRLTKEDKIALVSYDPKRDEIGRILKILGSPISSNIDSYVQSLVSLKLGKYMQQEQLEEAISSKRRRSQV